MDEETSESHQKWASPTGTAGSQHGLDLGTNSDFLFFFNIPNPLQFVKVAGSIPDGVTGYFH
jgi:hypothetical protein